MILTLKILTTIGGLVYLVYLVYPKIFLRRPSRKINTLSDDEKHGNLDKYFGSPFDEPLPLCEYERELDRIFKYDGVKTVPLFDENEDFNVYDLKLIEEESVENTDITKKITNEDKV